MTDLERERTNEKIELDVMLQGSSAYRYLEIKGKINAINDCEAVKELIKRQYRWEKKAEDWKNEVAKRRAEMQNEVNEIDEWLDKYSVMSSWKKIIFHKKAKEKRAMKDKLKDVLEEQLKTYRGANKIE
ncbi:MAG: hypothetical protein ACLFVB_08630 [Thermoplasmata archaeon]